MWITKQTENAEQIKLTDATSKVIIWAINHADSPEISRLGNLTHIPFQGFSNSDGTILVNTNSLGITLISGSMSLSCNYPVIQPAPLLYNITPREFQSILQEILGNIDYVALAEKLCLEQMDMDSITGKLIRSYAELSIPRPLIVETPLPIKNTTGNLQFLYCHDQGNVYEMKFFKYNDYQEEYPFLFKPRQSGVWFPEYSLSTNPWQFSTSIHITQANPGRGWICTAGGADNLKWEIFRHIHSEIILPYYPSDPLFNRTALSKIWPILTEAKRRNIKMRVRQVKAQEANPIDPSMLGFVKLLLQLFPIFLIFEA